MNKTKGLELMFFCDCGGAVFYGGEPTTAKIGCPACHKEYTLSVTITKSAPVFIRRNPEPVTPPRELDWLEQLDQYQRKHKRIRGWNRLCLKVFTWAARP
ncbi:MAG: hypothetical protein C4534_06505 [Gaiellales bacterium]|nr:MAG: hypothetical protein C4534_06505 [Gaiellales bacterium]